MKLFLCVFSPGGSAITDDIRNRYVNTTCCRQLKMRWLHAGDAALLVGSDGQCAPPQIVCWRHLVAVGFVRLDNRADVMREVVAGDEPVTDLELVTRLVESRGELGISRLAGDFAFVIWDRSRHRAIAARDPFGIKTLYYASRQGLVEFSSRAEVLSNGMQFDLQYLTEYAAGVNPSDDRTAFAGVLAIPPACTAEADGGSVSVRRFWAPTDFITDEKLDGQDVLLEFRDLFCSAVRSTISDGEEIWAELSGGLDSSSIVSVASILAEAGAVSTGIAGTLTYSDSVGAGADERAYANAVVRRFKLRNELLIDYVLWQEDGASPPLTDTPDTRYLLFARDRAAARIMKAAGGKILLSGLGSDHYLMGNMLFFADWIARGQVRRAIREMLACATLGRVSFWQLAYLNAALPLLPRFAQRVVIPDQRIPSWIPATLVRRFGISARRTAVDSYAGRIRQKYAHEVAIATSAIPAGVDHGVLTDEIEMRYPFLNRALVEFALRLPPTMCRRPNARKWILREAMHGILPEDVRTRRWKGTFDGRIAWSLVHERDRIACMLKAPVVGDLGCVDVAKLRTSVEAGAHAAHHERASVLRVLALETWLRARSGR